MKSQFDAAVPSTTGILGAVRRCEPPVGSTCVNADNAGGTPHPNGVPVNALNFADCEANLSYQFQIGISNPSSSYQLVAWAGTQDCSQLSNRQSPATSVCWPVAPFQSALVNPYVLNVRTQDIASGASTTTHPVTYRPTNGDAVCQAQTQTGAMLLTLYVFHVDGGSNPAGAVQTYPITFDTRAGDVPGSVSLGVGDSVLFAKIPPTSDPDTQGWNVYCDPPPAAENPLGDGGCATSSVLVPGGAASADDAGVLPVPGTMRPIDPKYLCAQAGATSTAVLIPNKSGVPYLRNGSFYNVAVAATDAVGNIGPLSNVMCGEPAPVADFWHWYSEAGGRAGGGACSAQVAGAPRGTSGIEVLLVVLMVVAVRRRSHRRRSGLAPRLRRVPH